MTDYVLAVAHMTRSGQLLKVNNEPCFIMTIGEFDHPAVALQDGIAHAFRESNVAPDRVESMQLSRLEDGNDGRFWMVLAMYIDTGDSHPEDSTLPIFEMHEAGLDVDNSIIDALHDMAVAQPFGKCTSIPVKLYDVQILTDKGIVTDKLAGIFEFVLATSTPLAEKTHAERTLIKEISGLSRDSLGTYAEVESTFNSKPT